MKKTLCGLIAVAALVLAPRSFAEQGNMHAALDALNQARNSLQKAETDKGGHRTNAIRLINSAIEEVNAGIQYDKTQAKEGKNKNN